jgi:glutaredoxin
MNYKIIMPTMLFVVVLVFSVFALAQGKVANRAPRAAADVSMGKVKEQTKIPPAAAAVGTRQTKEQIILFYGDGCPHCALVEQYVTANNVALKVPFVKKEVYSNDKNAEELAAKAKICGLPINSIGVPFLWDGSKCRVGDQDIIEFFKERMNRE